MGGKAGIRSAKRQRVVDMLDTTPEGLHTKVIADALEEPRNTTLCMMQSMAERGYVQQVREWVGNTHSTQVRWFLSKHKDAAMAASKLAGMIDETQAMDRAEKAARNIVPPRAPIVVTDAPRVVDSMQCRPWADAAARARVSGVA